jgi:phage antirepressor YoqD-like protein
MTMKNELALVRPDLLVDSRIIATALENQHTSSMLLIQNNLSHFEGFGVVRFEIEKPSEASLGGRPQKYALLNEDQCYFLLSLSRNNETVVALKAKLVMAFRQAREAAAPIQALPTNMVEALRLAADALERNLILEAQHAEAVKELVVAAPKVEAFDSFISNEGVYDFNTAAKLIGWGRNKMLEELRRKKILISEGKHKNLPYQRFIDEGYFEVKARTVSVRSFEKVTTTTYVTPRGLEYLRRQIGNQSSSTMDRLPRPVKQGQPSRREPAPLFTHQLQEQE